MSQQTNSTHQNNNHLKAIAESWKLYKEYNDRMVKEILEHKHADPLTQNAVGGLNNELDSLIEKEQKYNLNINRPIYSKETSKEHQSGNYTKAFCNYVRYGHEQELQVHQQRVEKSLSSLRDKDGGYLVSTKIVELVRSTLAITPIRSLASIIEVSNDGYEYVDDKEYFAYSWVDEEVARPETNASSLQKHTIPVHELYASPKATQRILDDAMIDIESWIAEKISESFANAEENAFIKGDGQGKPNGILQDQNVTVIATGSDGTITSESLLRLIYSLPERYAKNATLLMNRTATHQIRSLKCPSTGQYLWQPALSPAEATAVFGINVVESYHMPVVASNAKPVIIADFKTAYKIVDRHGIRILRDPYTEKPFVKFYSTKRVGGSVVNPNAIKILGLSK